jgi:predicted DNA-binding protein YlxM (UPF0122 family)
MKTETRTQARNLYFQTNLSQTQIANLLDVDRKTVYTWLTEGNWRQQKKLAMHMPSKIAEQYYYMLANMNHEILSRGHQPYPLTHEAEQMRKVSLCLRNIKNRQTVNESMEAYTFLAEVIAREEPDLAERINPYIQRVIQNRVDIKFADLVSGEYDMSPAMDEMFEYEIRPADDDDPTFTASADDTPAPDTPGGQPAPSTPNSPNTQFPQQNIMETKSQEPELVHIESEAEVAEAAAVSIHATAAHTELPTTDVPGSLPQDVATAPDSLLTRIAMAITVDYENLPEKISPQLREEIETAAGVISKIIVSPLPTAVQVLKAHIFPNATETSEQVVPTVPHLQPVGALSISPKPVLIAA